jgi:sugar O-acyltransferase (sialic acid O-acetyltransferase NeuD family)
MAQPLIILGTGGNAHDVLDLVDALNGVAASWQVVGFLADGAGPGAEYQGLPVLGGLDAAPSYGGCAFVSAIWNTRVSRSLQAVLGRTGLPRERFATLVHPAATVSRRSRIGHGVVIHHGVSVGGNVTIADQVWLGPGAIVGHDTTIGSCTALAPGAVLSGGVGAGRNCYVGTGALVRQQVQLGDGALVGMGAVVLRDVAPGDTVVGNPARSLVARGTEDKSTS